MIELFFFAFCFGFLMAHDRDRQRGVFSPRTGLLFSAGRRVIGDWLELLLLAAVVIGSYVLLVDFWMPASGRPMPILWALPVAYVLCTLRGRSSIFTVSCAGLCFLIMESAGGRFLDKQLVLAALYAAGGLGAHLLILGLRHSLLLNPGSRTRDHLALELLGTAFLALGLCGFQGILF